MFLFWELGAVASNALPGSRHWSAPTAKATMLPEWTRPAASNTLATTAAATVPATAAMVARTTATVVTATTMVVAATAAVAAAAMQTAVAVASAATMAAVTVVQMDVIRPQVAYPPCQVSGTRTGTIASPMVATSTRTTPV
jgi:hypothetical protein